MRFTGDTEEAPSDIDIEEDFMGFVTNELCIGIIDVPTTATITIYETKEKYLLSTEVLT